MTISALLGLLLVAASPSAATDLPEHFFVGRTEGVGVAQVIMSGRHGVRDRSTGRIDAAGNLIFEQVVQEDGKPARRRSWRLTRLPGNRITGTISDAKGPVSGTVAGNVIHLRYKSNKGPSVQQWITLQPDGRTATNRMVFRHLGMRVGTLQGTIRRMD